MRSLKNQSNPSPLRGNGKGAWFLSPDENIQFADFTQNYNRYSYCLNNPLKYNDPSGEKWKWPKPTWFNVIPVIGQFDYLMELINANTTKTRQKMVEAGVPDFNVGVTFGGDGKVNAKAKYRGQEVFNTENIDRSNAEQVVNRELAQVRQNYSDVWNNKSNFNLSSGLVMQRHNPASEIYYGGMSLAYALALADGPEPGPGDAAGIVYGTSTLITAGIVWTGSSIYTMSKGGRGNIWPDAFPKPNSRDINWRLSDSQLASGVTGGGVPNGPGSEWNKIKKWFRDTRRKLKGNLK